jgi:hypothetical protein
MALTDDQAEPLGSLLESLADPTCVNVRWIRKFSIGLAGTVTVSLDLAPYALTDDQRDMILSLVARLTNWSAR